MNSKISLKRIICFLLAVLMLLSAVGCKDGGKKKKVIKKVKKKVIVVTNDEQVDNSSDIIIDTDVDTDVDEYVRPKRDLPEVAEIKDVFVEKFVPEFEYEYKNLNITNDYVIVYSYENWKNRYESKNSDKTDRAIENTAFCRIAANDLATFLNEELGLRLKVVKDTSSEAQSATKKILVGDTAFYKSSLSENEFAVKLDGQNLIFEGGHFAMVEKAVDWYQTVELKEGSVATLKGSSDSFKSTVTLGGVQYDYVWGDEFDGDEFIDLDKWSQGTFGLERQDDMANIFNDTHFQYVENGRLRLTGDRYYDEGNADIGYATSGQIDTDGKMLFRNGYYEFRARLPYARGAFPAIWTMTADAQGQEHVPNWNYDDGCGIYSKRVWDLEFDLFESFADLDHMTTTIHKWYTPRHNTTFSTDPIDLTIEEEKMVEADIAATKKKDGQWTYNDPLVKTVKVGGSDVNVYYYVKDNAKVYVNQTEIDEQNKQIADGDLKLDEKETYQYMIDNGTLKPAHVRYQIIMNVKQSDNTYKPVDMFKYRLSPFTNMKTTMNTYAYSFSYDGAPSNRRKDEDGVYNWRVYFDPDTINNEYHLYGLHLTSDRCTVYMDNEPYLDFEWDPAYDYKDLNGDGKGEDISNNNNGVGFNFWQYFLIDMMIYTPGNFAIDEVRKLQPGDLPHHLYIDYVRAYQDLDDNTQAIYYPAAEVK